MPRHVQGIGWKDHRPRYARRPSVQLTVDKIPEAAEEQAGRAADSNEIGELQYRIAMAPGEERNRNGHPGNCAVEGKPASPYRKYLRGMRCVLFPPVNKDIDDPSSDQHAGRQVPDQIVEVGASHSGATGRGASQHQPIAQRVTDHVHHAVPAEREWSEGHDRGRNAWVWNYHSKALCLSEGGT